MARWLFWLISPSYLLPQSCMSQYTRFSNPDPEFLVQYQKKLEKEQEQEKDSALADTSDDAPDDALAFMRKASEEKWVAEAERAYGHLLPDEKAYNIADHQVPVEGGTIIVRAITPTANRDAKLPLLMHMHGGGWITGSINVDEKKLILLVVKHDLIALSVDYRLAPEHPFPIPVDDCFAVLKWVVKHTEQLHADLQKGFLVMGSSAGGHLAAVTARRACDDIELHANPITGQILQIPVTCHPDAYPEQYKGQLLSFDNIGGATNVNLPSLANEMKSWPRGMRWAWDEFKCEPQHPDASPLLGSFGGLPPMFVQVTGMDVLRDEGLLYESLAREAGVDTKLHIYPGVPHGFENEYCDISAAKRYNSDLSDGVKWLLQKCV